jgi:hypothetical protein
MICQLVALQIVSMLDAVMETLAELAESYKNHSCEYQKKRFNTYEKK